jgi:hypothetical protein
MNVSRGGWRGATKSPKRFKSCPSTPSSAVDQVRRAPSCFLGADVTVVQPSAVMVPLTEWGVKAAP